MTQDIVPHEVADSLNRRPIIETIEAQRLALLKAEVAPKASPGEVGVFLEIAARYDLDPFAKEIWCAGEPGKIMIMVGRDGLRKIAHRAGLRFDGDVVRERDYFKVTRNPDRTRSVEHTYTETQEQDAPGREDDAPTVSSTRGKIIGAWAEVYDPASGDQMGYFYAPLKEYRPKSQSKLQYSPWGSQESVMILAAAERQALRQATPLGGLLSEGEGEINAELADPPPVPPEQISLVVDEELVGMLNDLVTLNVWTEDERALHLGAAGAQDTSGVEVALSTMNAEQIDTLKHHVADLVAEREAQVVPS